MLSLADSQTLKFPILGVFLRHEKPLYCPMQIEMFVSIHLQLSFRQEVYDIDLSAQSQFCSCLDIVCHGEQQLRYKSGMTKKDFFSLKNGDVE